MENTPTTENNFRESRGRKRSNSHAPNIFSDRCETNETDKKEQVDRNMQKTTGQKSEKRF